MIFLFKAKFISFNFFSSTNVKGKGIKNFNIDQTIVGLNWIEFVCAMSSMLNLTTSCVCSGTSI